MPLVCGNKSELKSLHHLSQAGFSQISCVATAAVEWGGEGFIYRKTGADIRGSAGKEKQGLCLAVPVLRGPCQKSHCWNQEREKLPRSVQCLISCLTGAGTGLDSLLDNFCACRIPKCQDHISWTPSGRGSGFRNRGKKKKKKNHQSLSAVCPWKAWVTKRFCWGCDPGSALKKPCEAYSVVISLVFIILLYL